MATRSGTLARIRLRAAVRRQSWRKRVGTPAAWQAVRHAVRQRRSDIGQDGERSAIEHAIEPAGDVRVTAIVLVEHHRLVGAPVRRRARRRGTPSLPCDGCRGGRDRCCQIARWRRSSARVLHPMRRDVFERRLSSRPRKLIFPNFPWRLFPRLFSTIGSDFLEVRSPSTRELRRQFTPADRLRAFFCAAGSSA